MQGGRGLGEQAQWRGRVWVGGRGVEGAGGGPRRRAEGGARVLDAVHEPRVRPGARRCSPPPSHRSLAHHTATARRQLSSPPGSAELASRLVPLHPGEATSAARAALLWRALSRGVEGRALPLPSPPAAGPLGVLGDPLALVRWVQELQGAAGEAAPRMQALLARPGAQELLADVQWGLTQRAAARGIKLLAGWGAGSAGGGSVLPGAAPSPALTGSAAAMPQR